MAKSTDAIVLELLKKVQAEKEAIKAASSPKWETTCVLSFGSYKLNIQITTSHTELIEAYIKLLAKERLWKDAATALNLSDPPTHQGKPIHLWMKDLKTRTEMITIDKRKTSLETLEKRIDALVTVEQRRALEIEAIKKELES